MELTFTELDNESVNTKTYWDDKKQPIITPKKNKISYDDILSSLNMVVHNGILQFAPNQKIIKKQDPQYQQPQQYQQPHQQPKKQIQTQQLPQQPQGNNYIINKYFNDYKDPNIIDEPQRPLTREEYKQLMIADYIKRLQEKKRIAQIKPKKLLFDTSNIRISPGQQPKDLNKLFGSFKR